MMEKLKQVESTRSYVTFFNYHALKLIRKTPSEILCELGVRAFSGSRDVPKDLKKAYGLFGHALENAAERELLYVNYFKTITSRFKLNQDFLDRKANLDKMPVNFQDEMLKLNVQLNSLAQQGSPLASFSYAYELYQALRNGDLQNESKEVQQNAFNTAMEYFQRATEHKINSAHFYLGMIYYEGTYVKKNTAKALDHYIRGAAQNNAFCFFELARIYAEGDIEPKTPSLEFLYLKRSAEEGFVNAQHLLGIAYSRGEICSKNEYKALSWFRESVRNGNPVSYLNAGELLEGDRFKNKLFALVNYLGAYQHGAFFLQEKIETLRKDLIEKDGYRIPEVRFVDNKDL